MTLRLIDKIGLFWSFSAGVLSALLNVLLGGTFFQEVVTKAGRQSIRRDEDSDQIQPKAGLTISMILNLCMCLCLSGVTFIF